MSVGTGLEDLAALILPLLDLGSGDFGFTHRLIGFLGLFNCCFEGSPFRLAQENER